MQAGAHLNFMACCQLVADWIDQGEWQRRTLCARMEAVQGIVSEEDEAIVICISGEGHGGIKALKLQIPARSQ